MKSVFYATGEKYLIFIPFSNVIAADNTINLELSQGLSHLRKFAVWTFLADISCDSNCVLHLLLEWGNQVRKYFL